MLREDRDSMFLSFYNTDTSYDKLAFQCECTAEYLDDYDTSYYSESSDDEKGFFGRMIDRIINVIKKIKNKILQLFGSKKYKDLEKEINENPELKNKKIDLPDYENLEKSADQAIKDVRNAKTEDQIDDALEKHEKRKKGILKKVGIAAGVAVAVGTAVVTVKTIKSKNEKNLEEANRLADEAYKKQMDDKKKGTSADKKYRDDMKNKYGDLTEEKLKAELKLRNEKNKNAIDYIRDFDSALGGVSEENNQKIDDLHGKISSDLSKKIDMIKANKNLSFDEKDKLIKKEQRLSRGQHNKLDIEKRGINDLDKLKDYK